MTSSLMVLVGPWLAPGACQHPVLAPSFTNLQRYGIKSSSQSEQQVAVLPHSPFTVSPGIRACTGPATPSPCLVVLVSTLHLWSSHHHLQSFRLSNRTTTQTTRKFCNLLWYPACSCPQPEAFIGLCLSLHRTTHSHTKLLLTIKSRLPNSNNLHHHWSIVPLTTRE